MRSRRSASPTRLTSECAAAAAAYLLISAREDLRPGIPVYLRRIRARVSLVRVDRTVLAREADRCSRARHCNRIRLVLAVPDRRRDIVRRAIVGHRQRQIRSLGICRRVASRCNSHFAADRLGGTRGEVPIVLSQLPGVRARAKKSPVKC